MATLSEIKKPTGQLAGETGTITRTRLVKLSSNNAGPISVSAALVQAGIHRGAPYQHGGEFDGSLRAKSMSVGRWIRRDTAEVAINYTRDQRPPGEDPDNPIDRPIRIGPARPRVVREQIFEDRDGKPFVNAAGSPIGESVMKERVVPVVMVEVLLPEFRWDLVGKLGNVVNSKKWNGQPKRSVLLNMSVGAEQFKNDVKFWAHRFEFTLFGKEIFLTYPNIATEAYFNVIQDDFSRKKEIRAIRTNALATQTRENTLNTGEEITTPVFLNAEGFTASDDTEDKEKILKFSIEDEVDFNKL